MFKNKNERYYDLIIDKKSTSFLHDNGWLEVHIEIDSLKEIDVEKKVKRYKKDMLPKAQLSKTRLRYLNETINFLKK